MGQNIIAQALGMTQAASMAHHDPTMGPQHGHVVGDGIGVRGADADIDQGDPRMAVGDQLIGRHLRQFFRPLTAGGLIRQARVGYDRITRLHKGTEGIAAFDLGPAALDEFIHLALVVGEQHEALEMIWVGAGIMAQAGEGIIHPLGTEQR